MLSVEYCEDLDDDICGLVDDEFNKFADKNGVVCNYKAFAFTAKEDNKVVGVIKGHSFYKEVHISDLIVLEQYRGQHIGKRLVEAVEKYCVGNGFESITLSTFEFQAPEFYKKCGFEIEFVRENKSDTRLTKYFLIKYF